MGNTIVAPAHLPIPFTYRPGFDWVEYLEEQSHFDSLGTQIDTSIRDLAFVNAAVGQQQADVISGLTEATTSGMDAISGSIEAGFEAVSAELKGISAELNVLGYKLDEVRYAIEVGFQITSQKLGEIEQVLGQILEAISTPEKTWALEKYSIAKDLYRREMYKEALSYLEDALSGHGDHRGYEFDPSVHLLKGIILLGDSDHVDPVTIDVKAAKDCFEKAVKFSKPPRDLLRSTGRERNEKLFEPHVAAL